jgi:hypothetical protein
MNQGRLVREKEIGAPIRKPGAPLEAGRSEGLRLYGEALLLPANRQLLLATAGGYVENDGGGENGATDDVLEGDVGAEEVHAVHEGHIDKGAD